jgi:uncharacterized protein (UPF0548 family)
MIVGNRGLRFGLVDEAAALDGLATRAVNYDPAQAPPHTGGGGWHQESAAVLIGREPPGDPVPGGPWQTARALTERYEFADPAILRAVYRAGSPLLNRNMLMEGHFFGLRFYFGVRITHVIDETRGRERIWGWGYETLQGHLEQGRINFEVIKNVATGAVGFRVAGYARPARLPDPLVRLGFTLFGRWIQQRYYQAVRQHLYDLVRAGATPDPPSRPDGLVTAPATARTTGWDRVAPGWLHPGP